MKKKFKRILSVLLVFVMVLGLMPTMAFADPGTNTFTTLLENGESEQVSIENVGDKATFMFTASESGTYIMDYQVNKGSQTFDVEKTASASNAVLKTEFRMKPNKVTGYVLDMEAGDAYTLTFTGTGGDACKVTVGVSEPVDAEYFNGFWGYYYAPGTRDHYMKRDPGNFDVDLSQETLGLAFFVKNSNAYDEDMTWTASSSNAEVISFNRKEVIEANGPKDYADPVGFAPIFELHKAGRSEITITATYRGKSISETYYVTVTDNGGSSSGGNDQSGPGSSVGFKDIKELDTLLRNSGQSSQKTTLRYSGAGVFEINRNLQVPENVVLDFPCDLNVLSGSTVTVKGKLYCNKLNLDGTLNVNGDVNPSGTTTVNGNLVINKKILFGAAVIINGTVMNNGTIEITPKATKPGNFVDSIIIIGSDGTLISDAKAKLQIDTDSSITDIKTVLNWDNLEDYDITEEIYGDGTKTWRLKYVGNLEKLGTPTDLQWGVEYSKRQNTDEPGEDLIKRDKPGMMSWKTASPDQAKVQITLYRGENPEPIASWGVNFHTEVHPEYRSDDWFLIEDMESGIYRFSVQSIGDGRKYRNSDIAWSDEYVYVRPDERVGECTNPTWEDRNIEYVHWMKWKANSSNEYKDGYQVEYAYSATEDGPFERFNSAWARNLKRTDRPLDNRTLQQKGTGYYQFRVRMLSSNIEEYCNGQWSDWSETLDLREMPANVSENLSDLLRTTNDQSMTEDQIRKEVQQMDSKKLRATLLTDMENSGATVTLANIEKMVGGPAEVEVKPGASVFDTSEIDIVGANLNLKQNASGDPITLILDKPDEEHVIPERFDSAVSVKFSMSVTDVKNPKQLEVPVKITLPVPENINPEYLVIIHYHQDGTWTQEWPYVYEEDGKTYADFVLTSFSDFVLAEDVLEGGTPNTPENGGGQPDDGNQGEIGGSEEQPTYHESKETTQKIQKKEESIPEYVESGSWTSEDGKWTFADNNGEIYKNKWAAVVNPYANTEAGQSAFDWFFFDANGHMMTGWIFDGGRWYYLNPLSDGTQGRMMTGWQMINGLWYYLNPVSDGTKGAMLADAWIDNYYVDANGVWDETKTK